MKYYVYHLIDPRDNAVFYVGKGKNYRINQHEIEAKKGIKSKKCNKIRSIQSCGFKITKKIISYFETQEDALRFEAESIAKIGIDNLTNIIAAGPFFKEKLTKSPKDDIVFIRIFSKVWLYTEFFTKEKYFRIFKTKYGMIDVFKNGFLENYRKICYRRGSDWVSQKTQQEIQTLLTRSKQCRLNRESLGTPQEGQRKTVS